MQSVLPTEPATSNPSGGVETPLVRGCLSVETMSLPPISFCFFSGAAVGSFRNAVCLFCRAAERTKSDAGTVVGYKQATPNGVWNTDSRSRSAHTALQIIWVMARLTNRIRKRSVGLAFQVLSFPGPMFGVKCAANMNKTALLFAGRALQAVGMGQDLAEAFPAAKMWFDRANAVLGYDLAGICFSGPEAELIKTENAQPGIFLVSWVAFQMLKERVPTLNFQSTGWAFARRIHSLTAAGAMSFKDGLRIVRQRGRFMQEACDVTRGGMAAVIGLDEGRRGKCARRRGWCWRT